MKTFVLFVGIFVLFIAFDFAWFQIADGFFKSQLGGIARLHADGSWNIRLIPALLVYALMAAGVLIFILPHATSARDTLLYGGAFGLVGYGLYDLTNLATLTAWTVPFAATDMTWGTILCAVVSTAAFFASRSL